MRGGPSIDLNAEPRARPGYAANTLNCNTGSIGVSLCCMAQAIEAPCKPGPAAKLSSTIVHWTAGQHKASDLDREHYHS